MTYNRSDDCPHKPTSDIRWQESDCYWFYDAASGVGGFNRLGQTPNRGTGQLQLFLFKTGHKRFNLQKEDVAAAHCKRWELGQKVGSATTESLDDMKVRWSWEEVDCAGDLEFVEAFYSPRDWVEKSKGGTLASNMNDGGHLECSGRVKGQVRIGRETFDVDGLAHRDRSWGVREHSVVRQHRMFTGSFGPKLSFACAILQFRGGQTVKTGFVIEDGRGYDIEDLEILSHVSYDTFSIKGGVARIRFGDNRLIEITATSVQGFVTNMFGMTSTDHIAIAECDGQSGFCDIEASFLQDAGKIAPNTEEVHLVCNTPGLSDFVLFTD